MKNKTNHKAYIYFISIYIYLFHCVSFGFSQSDSLLSYLEIAAKNNPTVQQRFLEYQAALEKIPQAGSLQDPELNLGIFLTPMELVEGKQVADIRIMQMFPWFGTLKAAKDEMSLMAKAKFEIFRDAKLQAFYDVQRTWYELYKTIEDIKVSEKNVQILQTLERLTLIRFKSGYAGSGTTTSSVTSSSANNSSGSTGMQSMSGGQTPTSSAPISNNSSMQGNSMGVTSTGASLSDLYRVQIEIGELQNNIALLNNQLKVIKARFNSLLNRTPESEIFVSDSLKSDTLNVSLSLVSDSMLKNNPMLGMLNYEQQSLDARKTMVTRMGYPMIGLGVNYSLINKNEMLESSMNGKDMIMPMVSVTLPIYRKKYKAMQNEAEFLKAANVSNYQSTVNNLQTEYYQALQFYEDSERRIKLYSNQHMLASKSLDIMLKGYSTSTASLSDILRVRQQTLDYELKNVEALADYNTAIAWLKRLGGM